jgi:exodeoxyribonuclease VIII
MSSHQFIAGNVTITDHDTIGWPKTGLHEGIPFNLYRADDISQKDTWATVTEKAVSKSLICNFIEDPAAWKASVKKEPTAAMQAGSVLDCLLTEPDKFETRYVMSQYDEFRTNESKAWRQEMIDAGITVLKQDQFDAAQAQLMAIRSKPEAAALLDGARFQVAFRHKTAHPFASKGLIDILPDDGETIVDLKTCASSALESKRSLRKYIYDWMYHVQAGCYCEGYSIASGEERTRFKFIFVTSTAPYRVAVVELPIAAIMFGADIYRNGVNRFAKCLEENVWPSIWDGEVELDLPEYAYNDGGEA